MNHSIAERGNREEKLGVGSSRKQVTRKAQEGLIKKKTFLRVALTFPQIFSKRKTLWLQVNQWFSTAALEQLFPLSFAFLLDAFPPICSPVGAQDTG